MAFEIGDKVRTADQLSAAPVGPGYSAPLRRPGIVGVVKALPESEGGPYRVGHGEGGDGPSAYYHEHELTPVTADPTVPEQLAALRKAVALDLAGMNERLAALEQGADPEAVCRAAADALNGEAAIEAARAWCELGSTPKNETIDELMTADCVHYHAAADALAHVPELVRLAEAAPARNTLEAYRALHRAARMWRGWRASSPAGGSVREVYETPIADALQVLDELGIYPGPEPPEPAPTDPRRIPYEALRRLYERLSGETAYDIDDPEELAKAALAMQARESRLYVALCELAGVSPDDELPVDALASRAQSALGIGERAGKKGAELRCRVRQLEQESAELRDILAGGATDRPLPELAAEAMRLAGPVQRLLAHGENEIRRLVGGLVWWGGRDPIAAAVAEMLSAFVGDLVVLRPGEPEGKADA